jgi:hypothetical protein
MARSLPRQVVEYAEPTHFYELNFTSFGQIAIFELTKAEHEHEPRLTLLSKWERGYHINRIVVQDDIIVTSDALRSVDVLRWTGKKLDLVARDHSSLWPITIGTLGPKEIFVAEAS